MQKKITKSTKKRDSNQLAAAIVKAATSNEPEPVAPVDPTKNPAAVALGKLGGAKGGRARAAKLSARKRREIARMGAKARWANKRKDSD